MARRLLVLTCSARKRSGAELLPALERYDGPPWQVLRSVLREQPLLVSDVDTYVLSAAYGLISANAMIPWYDQTMTEKRADELHHTTLQHLCALLNHSGYDQCCLGLSQLYLRALVGWQVCVSTTIQVTVANGALGEKLGQVKSWLLSETRTPTIPPTRLAAPMNPRGRAIVAGVSIEGSREDVFEIARAGLRDAAEGIQRYRDWYVLVDGQPVAPKWLISKLTGRSTSEFSADAARRGLLALGVDVEHVDPR